MVDDLNNYYENLLPVLLKEAEDIFGRKTEYNYAGLTYHNYRPRVTLCETELQKGIKAFKVILNGKGAFQNKTDGIFQLSHEVIHLLSPTEQDEGNEVNYLEEGMACHFAEMITKRETSDNDFCDKAISGFPKYQEALAIYNKLYDIDKDAVKKLRVVCPVIANIESSHFENIKLDVPKTLIQNLLKKF